MASTNFTNSGEDSLAGLLTADYYNGQKPEHAVENKILPASPIVGSELEYIEVVIDDVPCLCIKTPAIVQGQGRRFIATAA